MGVSKQCYIDLVFLCCIMIAQKPTFDTVTVSVNRKDTDTPKISKGHFPSVRFKVTVSFYGENRKHLKFTLHLFCVPHMISQMDHMVWPLQLNCMEHWFGISMGIGKNKDIQNQSPIFVCGIR